MALQSFVVDKFSVGIHFQIFQIFLGLQTISNGYLLFRHSCQGCLVVSQDCAINFVFQIFWFAFIFFFRVPGFFIFFWGFHLLLFLFQSYWFSFLKFWPLSASYWSSTFHSIPLECQ